MSNNVIHVHLHVGFIFARKKKGNWQKLTKCFALKSVNWVNCLSGTSKSFQRRGAKTLKAQFQALTLCGHLHSRIGAELALLWR